MYTPILASLAYILSPDRSKVLLIRRDKRPDDQHFGKYNGLGGKLDRNEDILSSVKREIREEAGIECTSIQLRGTISWPGFGKAGEDWFGFVFRIDAYTGTPLLENPEGSLVWVEVDRIFDLPLWDGDPYFLPMVFDENPRPFHGVMPYKGSRPVSWSFERL